MGGGAKQGPYSNFMNKKSFHPASFWNQRKVWKAEEKSRQDAQRERELQAERVKEQSQFDVQGYALMSRADNLMERTRREVNFMYEPPPGFRFRTFGAYCWKVFGSGLATKEKRPRDTGRWKRANAKAGCSLERRTGRYWKKKKSQSRKMRQQQRR